MNTATRSIFFLLLATCFCLAQDPAWRPAGKSLDLSTFIFGKRPPEQRDGTLHFIEDANGSTAAQSHEQIDLSQGLKLSFEFKLDGKQTNPFPRLIDCGPLSIHLVNDSLKGCSTVKFLVNGTSRNDHIQIITGLSNATTQWHTATFTFEPRGHRYTLQIDNNRLQSEILFLKEMKLGTYPLMLGATTMNATTVSRGLNGLLRNLVLTTPFDPHPTNGEELQIKSPVINGKPVRHSVVCSIKHRHLAFPGVALLPNNDLAVVFREGEAHVCPYGRICLTYSKDGGLNWSAPIAVSDTESDERDPSIQTLPDGRILLTHGGWNSWMHFKGMPEKYPYETAYIKQSAPRKFGGSKYLFSNDNGHTWTPPIAVPGFAPHGPAFVEGKLIQPSLQIKDGKRQVVAFIGTSDAQQWSQPVLIDEITMEGNTDYQEPFTALLPNGDLLTAIREPNSGFMFTSRSTDKGQTWSKALETPVRGFPQHLLVLKDGRLLATYGYRYYPYGVRACISRDHGQTWDMEHEMVIQNNGCDQDLGYPVSLQLPDTSILTIYYHITEEHPSCFIEAARWTLE